MIVDMATQYGLAGIAGVNASLEAVSPYVWASLDSCTWLRHLDTANATPAGACYTREQASLPRSDTIFFIFFISHRVPALI